MYIFKPDQYLRPDYKISPFRTSDIAFNKTLPSDDYIDQYFDSRFGDKNYMYTYNGREAIYLALKNYKLNKDDVITILTSSGNYYVSSCVTEEIKKICRWSRRIEKKSKLIFVNHEFGYPYLKIEDLKKYNLPIIEDFAHSFFLSERLPEMGLICDYSIYSFPKMFQIQIGGLLVSHRDIRIDRSSIVDNDTINYVKKVLSYHIRLKDEVVEERIKNYKYLRNVLFRLGLIERFPLSDIIVPGVFMFRSNLPTIKLPQLKDYLLNHGIQSSVFYGEESFFIPVHQTLNEKDLDYFGEVINSFIKSLKQ
jgi:hypothetical protein